MSCVHKWDLEDLQRPFTAYVVCKRCGAVVRVSVNRAFDGVKVDSRPLSYGRFGLSLDDLERVARWVAGLLGLDETPARREAAVAVPVVPRRHKKVKA